MRLCILEDNKRKHQRQGPCLEPFSLSHGMVCFKVGFSRVPFANSCLPLKIPRETNLGMEGYLWLKKWVCVSGITS